MKVISGAILLITLFFQQLVLAQPSENELIAKKLESEAEELYRIGEYENALELFLAMDSLKPGNPLYHYRIGLCYLNSTHKEKSIPYLKLA
jgi:tetratricopeptide (TPR) repeat protein